MKRKVGYRKRYSKSREEKQRKKERKKRNLLPILSQMMVVEMEK
jgi:hypothetical protein